MEDEEELGEFLATAWVIWGARCRLLMDNKDSVPGEMLAYTFKIRKEAWEVQRAAVCGGGEAAAHHGVWVKPTLQEKISRVAVKIALRVAFLACTRWRSSLWA